MENKVAIVTGSSSGIGQGIAAHFAAAGARVVVTGRNVQGIDATRELCLQRGAAKENILAIEADVSKKEDIESIVSKTVEKFGQIDYLINNAGRGCFDTLATISWEEYNTLSATNERAVFWLCKTAVPHLVKTQGSVVNISSIAASRPTKFSAYGMGKAAVSHLTRCLATEYGKDKVRFNCIEPGIIPTNILNLPQTSPQEQREGVSNILTMAAAVTPLGRTGTPEDVAKTCEFMVREDLSGWLTGQCLVLDGGYTALGPAQISDLARAAAAQPDA